jgi:hypothetical protein
MTDLCWPCRINSSRCLVRSKTAVVKLHSKFIKIKSFRWEHEVSSKYPPREVNEPSAGEESVR